MKKMMPGVGIGIMILDDNGRVLLLLRNSDSVKADSSMHLEGMWTLPAGKINYGETIKQAAIRKTKEETNLSINSIEVISLSDDINEYNHFVTIGVVTDNYTGMIDLGDTLEHVDYMFYELDNLPKNICEPTKNIIRNYKNNRIYKGEC